MQTCGDGSVAGRDKGELMPAGAKRFAWVGVGLWFASHAAHANIFVEDRREQRDPSLPVLRSVGVLHRPEAGAGGTAFLVSNCHIATAYHVAFTRGRNPRTGTVEVDRPRIGQTADFLVGLDPNVASKFSARARASVVAFGPFSRSDFRGMAGDWAILRLDECLGRTYGYLKVARPEPDRPMPTGELMSVGFPRSRASQPGITVESGCRARDHGPVAGLVGVDCGFESGMSGGPVLERQTDGRWLVVGLIQQSMSPVDRPLPTYSMDHRNQMVYVTALGKAIDRVLRSESRRVLAERAR